MHLTQCHFLPLFSSGSNFTNKNGTMRGISKLIGIAILFIVIEEH